MKRRVLEVVITALDQLLNQSPVPETFKCKRYDLYDMQRKFDEIAGIDQDEDEETQKMNCTYEVTCIALY